jgi:hypothetical protein
MKIIGSKLILLASLALFGCGDNSADSTEKTVGEEVADDMQDAMQEAENVGVLLQENKDAMDQAIEDAD